MHFQEARVARTWCQIIVCCDPHSQFTSSLLRIGNDHTGSVLDVKTSWGLAPIHESIINCSHTADLIMKGANLHLTCDIWNRSESPKSPTSLAMLSSWTFNHWRESLHDSGVGLEDFVKKECESGSVVDEGWNEDTLLLLFQSEIEGVRRACDESCDRCNTMLWLDIYGNSSFWTQISIEVNWYLGLEKFKKRHAGHAGKDKVLAANTGLENGDQQEEEDAEEEDVEEGEGIHCPCVQEYTFVCWECWRELQDPNHEHWDTSETSSSAAIEELSDWEDSPFLLSI